MNTLTAVPRALHENQVHCFVPAKKWFMSILIYTNLHILTPLRNWTRKTRKTIPVWFWRPTPQDFCISKQGKKNWKKVQISKWKYLANIMSCVFVIFSVVKNVSCHYNVCSGETNFFIDSKRRHFIERSHYDDERIPYCKRFLEPIPLLFW